MRAQAAVPRVSLARIGHPVLRKVAEPWDPKTIPTAETKRLLEQMYSMMKTKDGCGLAAPQINLSKQVVVLQVDNAPGYNVKPLPRLAMFNPQLQINGTRTIQMWESCLSVPDLVGKVTRHENVIVNFLDENGQAKKLKASGCIAAVMQHEIDHLNGILWLDRLQNLKALYHMKEYEEFGVMEPDDSCSQGSWEYLD